MNGLEMGFLNVGGYYLYLAGMFFYAGLTFKDEGSTSKNLRAWGRRFWQLLPSLVSHYRVGMGALLSTELSEEHSRQIAGVQEMGKAHNKDVTGMVYMSEEVLRAARRNAGSEKSWRIIISVPQALLGVLGHIVGGLTNEAVIAYGKVKSMKLSSIIDVIRPSSGKTS